MKDLSPEEYRALAEFRHNIRKFLHFSEGQARAYGLEPQQHQLLLAVRGMPKGRDATVGELATRLRLKHHSTVELINRLETLGAVTRVRSETDRRAVVVQLTPKGALLLHKLSVAHRLEIETVGPELVRSLLAVLRSGKTKETGSKVVRSAKRYQRKS